MERLTTNNGIYIIACSEASFSGGADRSFIVHVQVIDIMAASLDELCLCNHPVNISSSPLKDKTNQSEYTYIYILHKRS